MKNEFSIFNQRLKRTLVFCHHGLGDLVMTLPTIEAALKFGRVVVVIKDSGQEELVRYVFGSQVRTHVLTGTGFLKRLKGFGWIFWKLICNGRYDAVILPRESGKALKQIQKILYLIRMWSPPPLLDFDGRLSRLHKADFLYEQLRLALRSTAGEFPKRRRVDQFLAGKRRAASVRSHSLILIAAGSGQVEAHKRWPASYYIRLCADLLDTVGPNVSIVWIGAQGDPSPPQALLNRGVMDQVGKISVIDSIQLMLSASLIVTHCNGAVHLAALSGLPIVALYGPTDFEITGPDSKMTSVLEAGLRCSPCYSAAYMTGCGEPACMSSINYNDVLKQVMLVING